MHQILRGQPIFEDISSQRSSNTIVLDDESTRLDLSHSCMYFVLVVQSAYPMSLLSDFHSPDPSLHPKVHLDCANRQPHPSKHTWHMISPMKLSVMRQMPPTSQIINLHAHGRKYTLLFCQLFPHDPAHVSAPTANGNLKPQSALFTSGRMSWPMLNMSQPLLQMRH